jgi:hypothetical protein
MGIIPIILRLLRDEYSYTGWTRNLENVLYPDYLSAVFKKLENEMGIEILRQWEAK